MKEIAEEDCIALICNGEFDDVPGTPIGELFEEFFDNINYNVVKENDIYVVFTGDAFCDDEPCQITIKFKVLEDLNSFEIDEVKVNEDILSEEEIADLIDDIAFISGALMETDDYCTHDCSHCSSNCMSATINYDEEETDDYDFDEEDDEEDDGEYDED